MNFLNKIFSVSVLSITLFSCKKDTDPILTISTGSERIQLNGIASAEAGNVAANSVYLDLSTEKTTPVGRSSWDIGLYTGADFRAILNITAVAGAKVTNKYDLSLVNAADTIGLSLNTSQFNPLPSNLEFFDSINGDLTQTVIPAISATPSLNPVIIINRGTGGSIAPRAWIKMRMQRTTNGYSLQYAGIQETTFKTISITKNDAYHFQFISFDNGIVSVEPEKLAWDLVWSYSMYQANFGAGLVPYNFSDIIAVNYLAGVQVKEKIYVDASSATNAFNAFNKDSVTANPTIAGRWTIANNWRSTQPAIGARTDRFYIIKDPSGNYYKLKCLAMGVGTDGGTRGKPEFKYALIP
jgi:HmuY protein